MDIAISTFGSLLDEVRCSLTIAGVDASLVTESFEGSEGLSRLFTYSITVITEREDVDDLELDVDGVLVAAAESDVFVVAGRQQIAIGLVGEVFHGHAHHGADITQHQIRGAGVGPQDATGLAVDDEGCVSAAFEQQAENGSGDRSRHVR